MIDKAAGNLPELFGKLTDLGCLSETEICGTSDGFCAATATVADILIRRGITTVPGRCGDPLECRLFFDDWHIYAVSPDEVGYTYGLFKMREQEDDAKMGRKADGDTPGVTVSFIALQTEILLDCLDDPSVQNRKRLNEEINRVVCYRGQNHSVALKQYFLRTEARGSYLIADLYTRYIASLARDGQIPVPERYAADYQKKGVRGRVARFIEKNNEAAGRVVCDHEKIFVGDPLCPTEEECLAILATHAGNTSFVSFAAEVQFHARFLAWWAKVPIPVIGRSAYDSAIRADMSIDDAEFTGPTPYYRPGSRIVRKQACCHSEDCIK